MLSYDVTNPTVSVDLPLSTVNQTPILTGTVSEPTASVLVTVGGVSGVAVNNGDGTWTYQVPDALETGEYAVSVIATDMAGNVSDEVVGTLTIEAEVEEEVEGPTSENQAPAPPASNQPPVSGSEGEPVSPAPSQLGIVAQLPIAQVISGAGDTPAPEAQQRSESSESDVLGEQATERSTPLEDSDVLGMMDNKFFGLVWYWWLVIVIALLGGWLLLAAAIRRQRSEEQ